MDEILICLALHTKVSCTKVRTAEWQMHPIKDWMSLHIHAVCFSSVTLVSCRLFILLANSRVIWICTFCACLKASYGPDYKATQLGPVVQSVVSLTSLLRVSSLTVLADSIYNILIFFAEKMWVAFALQKLLTFFQQKISAYLRINRCKF